MAAAPRIKYILADDHDIQGRQWRKGDTVYCVEVGEGDAAKCDIFLTHKIEYAKRGSHAPVHRVSAEHLVIEGETLRIADPNADEQL